MPDNSTQLKTIHNRAIHLFLQIIERKKKQFMSTFETLKAINYVLKLP